MAWSEEQIVRQRLLPTLGRPGQALRFNPSSLDSQASHGGEHVDGIWAVLLRHYGSFSACIPESGRPPPSPQPEYYAGKIILRRLKRALYGLRYAPRYCQGHFASGITESGFRLNSGGHVYVREESFVVALAYVGDQMTVGKPEDVKEAFQELCKCFPLKRACLTATEARVAFGEGPLGGAETRSSHSRTRGTR